MLKEKLREVKLEKLIPYVNNPKKHPEEQVSKIASSIKKFGFKVPMLVTEDFEIIAGHGRYKAAKKLGLEEVPCIVADDLTEAEIKAFRLADNRVAESEWDSEMLEVELEEIDELDFDIGFAGFDDLELEGFMEDEEEDSSKYTDKIESPVYEIKGDEPSIEELVDKKKFNELMDKIEDADIDEKLRQFLKLTAYRHIVFDYENIAEFFAHQSEEVQELMENLALVIVDYDKAIEQGFVDFADNVLEGVGGE